MSGEAVNGHVGTNGANGRASRLPIESFVNGQKTKDSVPEKQPANGRGPKGRFAIGNKGGPGNPYVRRVAQLRKAVLEVLTEEKLKALIERLYQQAMSPFGDIPATKLLLSYALGNPTSALDAESADPADELEECRCRLEKLEAILGNLIQASGAVDPDLIKPET